METFVLRIFVPADATGVPLCGVVEHVATGRAEPFHGSRGLIDVVVRELGRDAEIAVDARAGEDEQPSD